MLGCQVDVPTLEGPANTRIPAGVQPGQKLRLRAKGLARKQGAPGNLYAHVRLQIPKEPSERALELWKALAAEPE